MTAACFCFAAMNAVIRQLSLDLPPFEIVFFRNLFGLAFMLPWLARAGSAALKTENQKLYVGRSIMGLFSMLCWFSALALMPLAEATALSFTSPLFATISAVLVLGEVVRVRRWTATLIGFLGAMIVLRPGLHQIGLAEGLVLVSAATSGLNAILVKQLTRTESANAIVTYMTLYITPLSLVPALFVWVMPPLHVVPMLIALGLLATLGHQALTRAFAAADTSLVMSFDFGRLPFVAVIAWLAFGETPDLSTWVGAALIVAASVYIARREAALGRAATPAVVRASSPMAPPAAHD